MTRPHLEISEASSLHHDILATDLSLLRSSLTSSPRKKNAEHNQKFSNSNIKIVFFGWQHIYDFMLVLVHLTVKFKYDSLKVKQIIKSHPVFT
jgi:hypothetical protein